MSVVSRNFTAVVMVNERDDHENVIDCWIVDDDDDRRCLMKPIESVVGNDDENENVIVISIENAIEIDDDVSVMVIVVIVVTRMTMMMMMMMVMAKRMLVGVPP